MTFIHPPLLPFAVPKPNKPIVSIKRLRNPIRQFSLTTIISYYNAKNVGFHSTRLPLRSWENPCKWLVEDCLRQYVARISGKSVPWGYNTLMHTPGWPLFLHTRSIHFWHCPLTCNMKFLRFQWANRQSIDDALHYVVSRPSAHPFQMAQRRHDAANVHILHKVQ